MHLRITAQNGIQDIIQLVYNPVFSVLDHAPDKISIMTMWFDPIAFQFVPAEIKSLTDSQLQILLPGDVTYTFDPSTVEITELHSGILWPSTLQRSLQ